MAKLANITIEVAEGDEEFTVMRDGEVFALRQGEGIVLLGEDLMFVGGDAPVTVMHFLYAEDDDKTQASKETALLAA